MKVAVVGGGLAGLAAALECADAGAAVTLYEGRTRLGGATFSVERDGRWHRQRPAHRAPLLHRVPRRSSSGSASPTRSRSSRGCECRCCARASAPRSSRATACPHRSTSRSSLLRYPPLSLGERLAAVRAAAGAAEARPGRPRARRADLRRLAARARSEPGCDRGALEPDRAADAQPARRRGLARRRRAGLPHRPARLGRRRRHRRLDGAAPAPSRRRGCRGARARGRARRCSGTPVRAVRAGRAAARGRNRERRRGHRRRAAPGGRRSSCPPGTVDAEALEALGASPIVNLHVHYDRRVLDEPFAAAVGSPVQWVFDRTASSGVAEGQLVAVSLSAADAEIGEPVAALRERYLPALERLLPAARDATRARLRRHARAARDLPRRARAAAACGPGTRTSTPGLYLAGAWTDTGWPATMEGAVRSGLAAARAALADLADGRLDAPALGALEAASGDRHRHLAPGCRRARGARPRTRAPALAPAPRRLVEGRARDERDHRRRGSLPAPLPRPRRRRGDRGDGELDPREAARRRHVGDLLRRRRRPLDDGRGVRRAAARGRPGRRGAHAPRGGVRPRRGRRRADARLHPHVALAALALVVGRRAGDPAGADPAAAAGAALASTRSAAGRGRRSSRSRSSRRCGRRRPCRSGSTSCGRAPRRSRRAMPGAARSSCSTAGCTATSDGRSARCGGARCGPPSAGSSSGRSATARGAGSSRRGCGR